MASMWACRQDRIRFGPEYEQTVRDATERNGYSAEQLAAYRDRRLCEMVKHAAANVPYYRRVFREHGIDPEAIRSREDLVKIPVLKKSTVREIPRELVDERLDRKHLIETHTSGTTGSALELYRDRSVFGQAFANMDVRCHDVAGVRRRFNRSISVGVYLVAALDRQRPPFWVYNRHWKQLYMSCYHLAPHLVGHYVKEMRRFAPEYLEGYPSALYAIAKHIVDSNLEPVPCKACFTTAETLSQHQRETIQDAFSCRVYDQYGNAETAGFAAECEQGSLHISNDIAIIEVVDDDFNPLPAGQVGQLICTSLINHVQPFIRYQIGDLGALRVGSCSCGRPFPVLDHIEGRTDHVLLMRSGRKIGRLDPVFKDTYGIAAAQVVQDDWDKFRLRIMPGKTYTDAEGRRAANILREYLGEGEIALEVVEEIERTASGKFRAIVCNLPKDERP
jgi:phenylacetate-CoA ligase